MCISCQACVLIHVRVRKLVCAGVCLLHEKYSLGNASNEGDVQEMTNCCSRKPFLLLSLRPIHSSITARSITQNWSIFTGVSPLLCFFLSFPVTVSCVQGLKSSEVAKLAMHERIARAWVTLFFVRMKYFYCWKVKNADLRAR